VAQMGICTFQITGGIGGVGISRWHFQRQDLATITGTDADAAATAFRGVWQAAHSEIPLGLTVSLVGPCDVIDSATSIPIGSVGYSGSVSPVTASSTSHGAAGNGIKVTWGTATVVGHRILKGHTALVPLTTDAFNADGSVNSTISTGYATAAVACLAAMSSASLNGVVYHRPKKGTFTGGVAGIITSAGTSLQGTWLRSRRS